MPNHNFCDRGEENKMGDCNLSLSYNAPKTEEKLCKYAYCSWCPTCDRESPRRRTKSETNEPCRRKGKEMKSPMSRKYDMSLEYENMDLEYETKDARYDCCRIRSNLCELPTTYITNNYQNVSNLNKMSNGTNDFMDGIDKRNLKFSDIIQMQNMADKQKFMWKPEDTSKTLNGIKSNTSKFDVSKNGCVNKPKTPHFFDNKISPPKNSGVNATGQDYRRFSGINTTLLHRSSPIHNEIPNVDSKQMSTLSDNHFSNTKKNMEKRNSDFKLNLPNQPNNNAETHQEKLNSVLFDATVINNKKMDTTNFQEKYTKEIDILRGKLRQLRGANYVEVTSKTYTPNPVPPFFERMKECGMQKPNFKITLDNLNKEQPPTVNQNLPPATPKLIPMKMPLTIRPALTIKPLDIKSPTIKPAVNADKGDINNKLDIETRKNKLKMTLRAEREIKSTSKVSLKTRSKASLVRLRKVKHKITHNPPTLNDSESDYSGSDESEAEECVDDTSVSEDSVKELKTKPQVPVTVIHHLEAGDGLGWPLRKSLFPNIPPYIRFNLYSATVPYKLPNGRRYLKWKLSTITPIVVRKTLLNTGFRLVRSEFSRESNEWLGTWGKHMKSPMFQTLKETQKLNHFPGTFQLGRKDRLWRNIQRLICKFGYKEFGFIPQTYILPQELKLLKQNWEYKNGNGDEKWIIKPPASARGVGIRVINRWSQLPKRMALVVQKYISNPYLINGSKFDLRLYVLVTSFNPLRIYLYPDGLARFASAKYSDDDKDLSDRYMHLTNYSINKMSSTYTTNEDANACQGHKWTIAKLWEYMDKQGINTKAIWKKLEQLVIKTIISGESAITQLCEENMMSRYNCYELFGIDVLLDESLKAWLLEVNISPSLHSASPLDAHVKGPLVKALFDMAQFHLPPQLVCHDNTASCFEPKLYTTALTKKERSKHIYYTQLESREEYLMDILDELTGDDIRHLTQAEDELSVTGKFRRIFPTAQSHTYLQYMEPRYYNRLFDAWESQFDRNRQPGIKLLQSLCAQKVHLKVASQSVAHKNLPSMNVKDMKVEDMITASREQQDYIMQKITSAIPPIKEMSVDLITVAQN